MHGEGLVLPFDRTWVGPGYGSFRPYYVSYEHAVMWSSPLQGFTIVRDVPFTTKAGLDSALAAITAGDYIHYTGTGKLTISSSAANGYTITAPQPTALAIVDFGNHNTANYVEFSYTGASTLNGIWVRRPHNVFFIGGSATAPNGDNGILWYGGQNSGWYDFYAHDCGTDGFFPVGASSDEAVTNNRFRGEVTNWGLVGAHDSHTTDPGSGMHGAQISDGNSLAFSNNVIAIYAHDAPSGAGMQIGDSPSTVSVTNNTIYLKAKNLNFSSTATTTDANALQAWGPATQTGNVVELLQAENVQGQAVFVGSLTSTSYSYTIKHARAKSVNLDGRKTNSYDTSKANVVYRDSN